MLTTLLFISGYQSINPLIHTSTTSRPSVPRFAVVTSLFVLQTCTSQLLADSFAKNGVACYAADLFNGNAIAADALSPGSNFDVSGRAPLRTWGEMVGSTGQTRHFLYETSPPMSLLLASVAASLHQSAAG